MTKESIYNAIGKIRELTDMGKIESGFIILEKDYKNYGLAIPGQEGEEKENIIIDPKDKRKTLKVISKKFILSPSYDFKNDKLLVIGHTNKSIHYTIDNKVNKAIK